ncbi:MAG TPA: zinc-dependent metalloprotease [Rhizomicrobium sp.]|nr:zinc-dependent metalloprotease [Rhizomicrobium sp.]
MRSRIWLTAVAAVLFVVGPVAAAENEGLKPYEDVVGSLKRQDGLLPVFVDRAKGHIYIQLPPPGVDGISGRFLYLTALKTGLGSAPAGLDRARLGETRLLVFRRLGAKIVAEYENPRFRAVGAPPAEQEAARESFATSTVWAGDVAAVAPDGGALVDISKFVARDVFDAPDALKEAGEKGYKLAADLSFADPAATKVFPENLEFEGRVTFTSDTPSEEVSNIVPDPKLFTLVVRHSIVKLPEPGFKPRLWDPRAGGFSIEVVDYAAPLGQNIVYRLANHFRLEKVDPTAGRSRVKKPIVFYIDRAAPEPIRSALVEGVNWWAKAFDAAGYIDAFRAEVMPEGMDPLDVRYNVVNWIDRATRGWSYGQSVVDPRTGEIIKGSVLLGSLRVRQDMLIFEGLVGAKEVGTGGPNDPVRVALARIHQLGAHEVGHALGFAHNFAGSTQDRASVMDYPPPRIKLTDGRIDLSDAYGVGVGKWDFFTVDWLYGDVPDGEAGKAALDAKVRKMLASGLRYVTDADSRPLGAAQPWGNLWDDGADPVAELTRLMQVRRVAIANFGLGALRPDEATAQLRRKYVPIYLLHRYQVDATSKLVAGVDYPYSVASDAQPEAVPVAAATQRAALRAVLATLQPAALDTPERLIPLLSVGEAGERDRQFDIEVMAGAGGPVFDPLVAADIAGGLPIDALLAPDRLDRLVDQHRRDARMPGVDEIVSALIATCFPPTTEKGRLADIRRRVQYRLVLDLEQTLRLPDVSPEAKAAVDVHLKTLAARLKAPSSDLAERAHRGYLIALMTDRKRLEAVLANPHLKPEVPPGMPIGEDEE